MRLTELTKLEDFIKMQLKRAPADYVTPRCQFIPPSLAKFKISNGTCYAIVTPYTINNQIEILVPAKKATSKKKPAAQSAPVESENNMSILATLRSQSMNMTNRLNETRGKIKKQPTINSTSSTYGPKEVYRYAQSSVIDFKI